MPRKVYFFESHPVQYKAPVYQELQRLLPGSFEVIYATDASVRPGYVDSGFGTEIAWDIPLLTGYPCRVLNNERGVPLTTSGSLSGTGVLSILLRERPAAIVSTQFRYRFDRTAFCAAFLLGIPILLRQETQDEMYASVRSRFKNALRDITYRTAYRAVRHAFAFGALNYEHLLRHGISPERISFARFSVPDPFRSMNVAAMEEARARARRELEVGEDNTLVAFFGKLIAKKAPQLLLDSLAFLPDAVRRKVHVAFIGSGKLHDRLQRGAREANAAYGVPTSFTGFINQSRLPAYYLAADILVLPSYQEAWGLVVNEALNAGCGAVLSASVGCQREFAGLERVRVTETGNAEQIAHAIVDLARFPRDFRWASIHMANYSTEAAARGIAETISVYL